MPYATGYAYAKSSYNVKATQDMSSLIENLKTGLTEMFTKVSWMAGPTLTQALKKASNIVPNIAYPSLINFNDPTALNNYYSGLAKSITPGTQQNWWNVLTDITSDYKLVLTLFELLHIILFFSIYFLTTHQIKLSYLL